EVSNRLARETSPYLLEHANNPVDWYPWGPEALARARRENKPILLSIGYSACHWCHVMARESFEDSEIAALINRDFVAIKVDRDAIARIPPKAGGSAGSRVADARVAGRGLHATGP